MPSAPVAPSTPAPIPATPTPTPEHAASPASPAPARRLGPVWWIVATVGLAHGVNDCVQSLLSGMYPVAAQSLHLSYGQIGVIACCHQGTASLLQPLVGLAADRFPLQWLMPVGMLVGAIGLLLLAHSHTVGAMAVAAACVGIASSIFHPEGSRLARLAAGHRPGAVQSCFQLGGNAGSAVGPLVAAGLAGMASMASCAVIPFAGALMLVPVARWGAWMRRQPAPPRAARAAGAPRGHIGRALTVLMALTATKYIYLTALSTYLTFFLIARFHVSAKAAQTDLFLFALASAIGVMAGGPIGDRLGRRAVIWVSILGCAPFALALPWVPLWATVVLAVIIALIISSAFSAILVMAQELVPGRVGMLSGLFFGLAFGIGALAAVALGKLADHIGIVAVYHLVAFLPLLGLIAAWLPREPARS